MEVTSNIWGTKFKLHGLAKDVPANLGQVTYKTSLLHLQPRQMTLMITDLSEEELAPDPNFNPNIFSEDEEDDVHNTPQLNNNRKYTENLMYSVNAQNDSQNASNNNTNATIARSESYVEFPYMDTTENANHIPENIYTNSPIRHAPQPSERRLNNTSGVSNRHAISPLRCDGSVPTLQSPKNAVAPTDIIFERPSPQTVACGGRGDFCGGRADYTVRNDGIGLKEQQSFNLNLTLETARPVTIKKCESLVSDNCLSKLRKNICSRGESTYETRIVKNVQKNYESDVTPDTLAKRIEALKTIQWNEDLKYIDEETPVASISNLTERGREVRRAAAPISPVCGNVPVYAAMPRSCSVGYLDMVDRAAVSVAALREPPRRLVLVPDPRKSRRRDQKKSESLKSPKLNKCGKSRSLDSSELASLEKEEVNKPDPVEVTKPVVKNVIRLEYPVCAVCVLVAPYERPVATSARYVCVSCSSSAAPAPPPSPRENYSKYYSQYQKYLLYLFHYVSYFVFKH